VLAAGFASGDARWRDFGHYGLVSAFKPMAYLAVQASYWAYAAADRVREYR
jgi:gamma-glutamylputrescine oxidase